MRPATTLPIKRPHLWRAHDGAICCTDSAGTRRLDWSNAAHIATNLAKANAGHHWGALDLQQANRHVAHYLHQLHLLLASPQGSIPQRTPAPLAA